MAVKIQFTSGQFTHDEGVHLTLDTPGLVVFNGQEQEIYVDGKTFGASAEPVQELINRILALENFRKGQYVAERPQAQVTVNATTGTSQLLIANIGQSDGGSTDGSTPNDGKIFSTGNFSVKLDGVYSETPGNENYIATQATVKNAVEGLKAEILGTVNPEELDKTLDTIKEIQDVLINGSYTIDYTYEDPETHETVTETLRTARVETIGAILYTDGEGTLYATENPITHQITYEPGYSDLTKSPSVENLVASVNVNEIKDHTTTSLNFVTASRHNADVTLNVNFGTFKTGDAVMDPTSDDYIDGLATVEEVQEYIEKRFSWMAYETEEEEIEEP